jgi:hypothetical protein
MAFRRGLFCSTAVHLIAVALAVWATRGGYRGSPSLLELKTTRAYAVSYVVMARPEIRAEAKPERRPARRSGRVIPPKQAITPPSKALDLGAKGEAAESWIQVHELPPGQVAGIGQVITTAASDASPGSGLLGRLGFRVPGESEVGTANRGIDRVAELPMGAGSACPELRVPAQWAAQALAVTVAFVVDTNGKVDRSTMQVLESPGRPQTEHRYHSHIYVVGATVRTDPRHIEPAVYDSLVTHEVASYVADLAFRPALKQGRVVRSTVLISCQTSRPN